MAKKFKKLDDNTLEITDEPRTISKHELEQSKTGLEDEIATLTDALDEVSAQLDALA